MILRLDSQTACSSEALVTFTWTSFSVWLRTDSMANQLELMRLFMFIWSKKSQLWSRQKIWNFNIFCLVNEKESGLIIVLIENVSKEKHLLESPNQCLFLRLSLEIIKKCFLFSCGLVFLLYVENIFKASNFYQMSILIMDLK